MERTRKYLCLPFSAESTHRSPSVAWCSLAAQKLCLTSSLLQVISTRQCEVNSITMAWRYGEMGRSWKLGRKFLSHPTHTKLTDA